MKNLEDVKISLVKELHHQTRLFEENDNEDKFDLDSLGRCLLAQGEILGLAKAIEMINKVPKNDH